MPLSRKRMQERKRLDRNVKPKSNLKEVEIVKPMCLDVLEGASLRQNDYVKPDLLDDLSFLDESTDVKPILENVKPEPPIYRAGMKPFPPGTKVRIWQGRRLVETVMPELDADGKPMPEW